MLSLSSVRYCRVYNNPEDTTDSNGVPPKSFEAVIDGGVAEEIAEVINKNTPIAIKNYGTTTVSIVEDGLSKDVYYTPVSPVVVDIYVDVYLTEDYENPSSEEWLAIVNEVETSVINYLNNINPGEDLIDTRVAATVVTDVESVYYAEIGFPFNQIESVAYNEKATSTPSKIGVSLRT